MQYRRHSVHMMKPCRLSFPKSEPKLCHIKHFQIIHYVDEFLLNFNCTVSLDVFVWLQEHFQALKPVDRRDTFKTYPYKISVIFVYSCYTKY